MSHEKSAPSNFVRAIIDEDLRTGKHSEVVTRFPPEPNGYLHIGHAKSICLNFGLAKDYPKARCHLRFDDTNPLNEDIEFANAIQNDIRWLGFDWGEHLYNASDYFGQLYDYAVELIKQGKAYVCSLPLDKMRELRGTVNEPGKPSPDRDRSVEENLKLFAAMRAGEFEDGAYTLRAKIDMSAANMLMRDPPLYRIRHQSHHNTGDAWCIYPMYDFCHCLSDAIEGITHSLCSLEFENNRELYDWILDQLETPSRPHQYEFARLKLEYTVMSKRILKRLVQEGVVDGWDDPRLSTLAAMRRRGVRPEAIRDFCDRIGLAKANSLVDMALYEFSIREDLNQVAPRVMAVIDPLKVVITNYAGGDGETLVGDLFPHDIPKEGTREIPFGPELFIERSDFAEVPPKKWRRLSPGGEVRFRHAYIIRCDEAVKNDAGEVVELRCTYFPESKSGSDTSGKKVKGVIHWVDAKNNVPAEIRLYDRLFKDPEPDTSAPELAPLLNPNSLVVQKGYVERYLGEAEGASHWQFERHGFFFADPKYHQKDAPVFNLTVRLKDSFEAGKNEAAAESTDNTPRQKRQAKGTKPKSKERAPLSARAQELVGQYGLDENSAALVDEEDDRIEFFKAAAAVDGGDAPEIAKWMVNVLLAEVGDAGFAGLAFAPKELAVLTAVIKAGEISSKQGKDVMAQLLKSGGETRAIIKAKGMEQLSDPDAIGAMVEEILAANGESVEAYRGGRNNLMGFFVGQVMKKSQGKANPKMVNEILRERLG